MSNHYESLGLASDASPDDVKKAFRRLARENHPDANPDDPEASERYKSISEAYAVLSDPNKRSQYDRALQGGEFGSAIDDLFGAFFGGGFGGQRQRTRARRGESLAVELEVDFAASVFGGPQTLEFKRAEVCTGCGSTGCKPGTTADPCRDCQGTGQRSVVRESFLGRMMTTTPCATCEATGFTVPDPCTECAGSGRTVNDAEVEFELPGGFNNGDELALRGEGNAGVAGGPPGDLVIRLRVIEDDRFVRRGDDLLTEVEVPLTVAALGGRVVVETLDGERELEIEPGTQGADVHTLRGLGHSRRRGRGDLQVIVRVQTPTDIDAEQRALLEQLAELRGESVAPAKGKSPIKKLFNRDDR